MKKAKSTLKTFVVFFIGVLLTTLSSCGNDDDTTPEPVPTGQQMQYAISEFGASGIAGTMTFAELDDNTTAVTFALTGTTMGGDHPVHIHANSAAEGGAIVIDLTNVDGATGTSETIVTALNSGNAITYTELINFDGYINVHSSSTDLGTLLAQGDIGDNKLTGMSENFELYSVSDPNISGEAIFYERMSGETLVMVQLEGAAMNSNHPAHIHMNTAISTGSIVIDLSNVIGGMSKTNVGELNDGTPITYAQLKNYNGYINIHNSEMDLGTLVAQGDIGLNALTGDSETYALAAVSDMEISGTVTFKKRRNGLGLAMISLDGTTMGMSHPAHIHMNTAAETGNIMIQLNNVDGTTGISATDINAMMSGMLIGYDDLIELDGYINVHKSEMDLSTLIAQGDIGQNALTGVSETYDVSMMSSSNISGTIKFEQRSNGEALVTISLMGTMAGDEHPTHIHMNDAATGGSIVLDLNPVIGMSGMSKTNVNSFNDDSPALYNMLIMYDGYLNVHKSAMDLATIVAQGDIGANG
jgi:hypothetical protein